MKNVIILFTPTHTGTHFVRMLLESHPSISTAIGEDFRIDARLRPGYVLAGLGVGTAEAAGVSERMLLEYFRNFLRGTGEPSDFQRALEYWQTISAEKKLPLSHYERHLANVREEFRSLGIELATKEKSLLLYRAHCHGEHTEFDLTRLTHAFAVVVTVRHPLLSILTTMRRKPLSEHAALIESHVQALQCVFKLDGAFFFCTDLWQSEPERMKGLFRFLDLPLGPATERFLAQRPRINCTVERGDNHGKHNYCYTAEHPPEFVAELKEAAEMFAAGTLHPLLRPAWSQIQQAGLLGYYRRLGYAETALEFS